MTYRLHPARPGDAGTVAALWDDARSWLAEIGSDQWQYPVRAARVAASIAAGECWIVDGDTGPVATVTLDGHADPDFWTEADDPGSALYVHRMVVRRSAADAGLGGALLDWASRHAAGAGRSWLRLDCWVTNHALRRWYAAQGFTHVRTVVLPHRRSGALYQRPAGVVLRGGPELEAG